KMKIMVQNSSGAAITTSMHMQVKVKHPVFGTMNYIIEDLSGGITYLPILNNSNWAKVSVYPNEGPPVEKTLNLALTQNNVTVQIGEMTFRRPLPNGSLDSQGINVSNKDIDPFTGINMTFYRNADGCNTPNPPESCVLTRMDANDFNPMVVMMAGKVNLELKMTGSGTTLFFVNFDLLSAKPPTNSIMSNNASSASASAQTQTWEAGSFVPHVYDHAFVVMPYNESRGAPDYINESLSSFNMSLPYLKDENWNIVWNGTNGSTTASLPDEYTDFNAGIYAPLLRTGGSNCSLTNASSACFMNKTNSSTIGGYFSLRVPHFSGVGAGITGLAPAAGAAATTTTTTTSGASSGSTAETEVSESRTFTNIAANSENTFRISNAEKIGVNALVFSTTEDLANVRVTVTKLVARPSSVDKAPEGGLYRYIEVDAPMLEGKLKEAKVQFEVTKKWLDDNDYKPEHIRLVRFADNSWRTLTTSILSEQSDKVFYEAITPGFSYFAITAVKEAEEADAEEAEEAEDTSVGEDALITAPTAEEKESSLIRTLLIVVGVLALLLLAALGYKKKRVLVFWREPTDKERQEHLRGQFLKRKKQQSWGGGND
ncbi:MAG: PGF-pre-PGF domain-containing protein, partial [Nanoarchaeota archaeon]|nr:PGF-pre-PGF domain-containing protein [Nanoarchaeota archaeon]